MCYRCVLPVDIPAPLWEYRAMLGETREPILPHPRSGEYMRECKKQMPISKCALEMTRDLAPPVFWTPLATNTAAGNGVLAFTNTPPAGNGFYRTWHVPGT
jgi:hypothetical protein